MKQETQAILYVAKLVGIAALGSAGMLLALTYISLSTLIIICGICATGFFLKCMYSIALSDIKYRAKLEEMTKK